MAPARAVGGLIKVTCMKVLFRVRGILMRLRLCLLILKIRKWDLFFILLEIRSQVRWHVQLQHYTLNIYIYIYSEMGIPVFKPNQGEQNGHRHLLCAKHLADTFPFTFPCEACKSVLDFAMSQRS